jgi:hypothetical protein
MTVKGNKQNKNVYHRNMVWTDNVTAALWYILFARNPYPKQKPTKRIKHNS